MTFTIVPSDYGTNADYMPLFVNDFETEALSCRVSLRNMMLPNGLDKNAFDVRPMLTLGLKSLIT